MESIKKDYYEQQKKGQQEKKQKERQEKDYIKKIDELKKQHDEFLEKLRKVEEILKLLEEGDE